VKFRKEKVITSSHQDEELKVNKKVSKDVLPTSLELLEEVEIEDKIRLKTEIYKDDNLLYSIEGFNSQIINFVFEATPYIPEAKGKKGEGIAIMS